MLRREAAGRTIAMPRLLSSAQRQQQNLHFTHARTLGKLFYRRTKWPAARRTARRSPSPRLRAPSHTCSEAIRPRKDILVQEQAASSCWSHAAHHGRDIEHCKGDCDARRGAK